MTERKIPRLIDDDGYTIKFGYQYPLNKRWEISQDQYSQERINAIRNLYKKLQADLSFESDGITNSLLGGITLDGSLSKGKFLTEQVAANTDVEFAVYYDVAFYNFYKEILDQHPDGDLTITLLNYAKPMNVNLFNSNCIDQYCLSDYLERYIRQQTEIYFANIKPLLEVNTRHFIVPVSSLSSVRRSIFWAVSKALEDDRGLSRTKFGTPQQYWISKFFGLDIGGGMRKYVQSFLRTLLELHPLEREKYWGYVAQSIKMHERGGNVSETLGRQYLTTFEDACQFYKP